MEKPSNTTSAIGAMLLDSQEQIRITTTYAAIGAVIGIGVGLFTMGGIFGAFIGLVGGGITGATISSQFGGINEWVVGRHTAQLLKEHDNKKAQQAELAIIKANQLTPQEYQQLQTRMRQGGHAEQLQTQAPSELTR